MANDDNTLTSLSDADLDGISGGSVKGKAAKYVAETGKAAWKNFKSGLGEGVKTTGQAGTVAAGAEAGSRAVETTTGYKIPRPSDAITPPKP